MAVKKIENNQPLPKIDTSAVIPDWTRGEQPPASARPIETSDNGEDKMDNSSGMITDATKTTTALTKATEQVASFSQGNIEAIMRSGQIWTTGCQALSKTMAATAQAHLDQTMSIWKALSSVRSLKEAMELQTSLPQRSFETAFAETGKLTTATMKVAEQAMAPIVERFTLSVEKLTRPSE
jgi:phasin family protein